MFTPRHNHWLVSIAFLSFAFGMRAPAQSIAPSAASAIPAATAPKPVDSAPTEAKYVDTLATGNNTADLKHYVITDYGAAGDGTTLNTAAIQKAIDTATAAGGGVLEVPKGTFLSGALFFKKGVQLYLDEGAVLLGSQDINNYPKQTTRIEGHFTEWRVALINFTQLDHVRVGGPGQLNGNGAPFWAEFYARRTANRQTTNLDVERPRLMFVDRCQDVQIKDVSFQDSGFWNLHLYDCKDVLIQGLHINAPSPATGGKSPSTDGIDVDSCQNVTIRQCQISNNDDDIALKGSKGPHADQDNASLPDENILIEDCTFGDGSGVLTCGSEATVIRDVTVRNCTLNGNGKILTVKLRPDTPQHYSNITIDGIKINSTGSIIGAAPWTQFFDLEGQPAPARAADHITIRNVTGKVHSFGSIYGNKDNPRTGIKADTLSDFTFENINITTDNPAPLYYFDVSNLVYKNVVVNGQPVEVPAPTENPPREGRGRGPAPGGVPESSPPAPAPADSPASATSAAQ